jgi:hypothetical protein
VSKICTKGRVTFFLSLSFILILYRNFEGKSNFNRSKNGYKGSEMAWKGRVSTYRAAGPKFLRIKGKRKV